MTKSGFMLPVPALMSQEPHKSAQQFLSAPRQVAL